MNRRELLKSMALVPILGTPIKIEEAGKFALPAVAQPEIAKAKVGLPGDDVVLVVNGQAIPLYEWSFRIRLQQLPSTRFADGMKYIGPMDPPAFDFHGTGYLQPPPGHNMVSS